MLAGLRHRAVGGADDQDRAVHLRRAGDHVLHIVGVARAVDMGIMPVRRLILDMRRGNRDAAGALFRGLVDLVIGLERRAAGFSQNLCDRSRQGGLAVIHVTDRPNIHMRLITFKFCLGHLALRLFSLLAFIQNC